MISIHAPARGATIDQFLLMFRRSISIHAPARGATATVLILPAALPHFNPRSRKGSDFIDLYPVPFDIAISIHAPARGATLLQHKEHRVHVISIHAPARGATSMSAALLSVPPYFNPRSRKGSDDHAVIFAT